MSTSGFIYLNSDGSEKWFALIRRTCNYDVYHLPFYHHLANSLNEGNPALFHFEEDGHVICLPLLLRPIDEVEGLEECGRGHIDATSVYGYPGPICSSEHIPAKTAVRFQESLVAELKRLNVISLFSRLHPVTANLALTQNLGLTKFEGHTVSVDASLSPGQQFVGYRRNHRKDIEKLRAIGMVCRETNSIAERETFVEIYNEAMRRIDASRNYFFPDWWYETFLTTTESTNRLFLGYLGNKPVCGALVAVCNGFAEMHLAATRTDWITLSPLKLLFDHVRSWAGTQHATVLHLGGGVGAKADSLFRFKSGFSQNRHAFHTWRWVVNEPVYDTLVSARAKLVGSLRLTSEDDFFPAYRSNGESSPDTPKSHSAYESNETADLVGVPHSELPRLSSKSRPAIALSLESQKTLDTSSGSSAVESVRSIRILILGAGGHARVIADAIQARTEKASRFDLVGFLDDNPELNDHRLMGKSILGPIADVKIIPHDAIVVGIGDNDRRSRLFRDLSSQGETFATIVHPKATLARNVKLGIGTVVFAGVVVNAGATIGDNVILNTACTVDHDCIVESHSHICPGVHLGGTVKIGEGAFVGIGSSVIHNRSVGSWATVGGGAAVIRDVLPQTVVVGVPAKPLLNKQTRIRPDDRDVLYKP